MKKLLYNKHRNILVIITKSMLLSQYSVSVDGKLTEMMKVSVDLCDVIFCLCSHVESLHVLSMLHQCYRAMKVEQCPSLSYDGDWPGRARDDLIWLLFKPCSV